MCFAKYSTELQTKIVKMQRIRLLVLLLLCVVCQQTFAQQRTISGLVISAEDHEPLIGATISVQGNEAHGVVTDIDGKYTLEVGPDDKILVVAYLGMKTQLIKVPKKEHLNVVLQPETMNLEEVVVTGYGNFTKSSFTFYGVCQYPEGRHDERHPRDERGAEAAGNDHGRVYYQQFRTAGS